MIAGFDKALSYLASQTRRKVARETAAAASARWQQVPEKIVDDDSLSSSTKAKKEPHLIFYEYEASPWCRLVREYTTILDLKVHIRPCPRQTLFAEGAFDRHSRYRPEAMAYLQEYHETDDLTFPLLVDKTDDPTNPMVVKQSYDILQHLWDNYDQDDVVVPGQKRRPDQKYNSPNIPFPIRFLSLAAPSYLRPWPTCGVLRTPSTWDDDENNQEVINKNKEINGEEELILYQSEGCPESRRVREILCTLEIPYLSIPVAHGSRHPLPNDDTTIPILTIGSSSSSSSSSNNSNEFILLEGADACIAFLWDNYQDPNGKSPKWWSRLDGPNLGRAGSFGVGAYTAFVKGSRSFVPPKALR